MKRNIYQFLLGLALILAACSQNTGDASVPQSDDVPPSPYPDTPSPVAIDAPLIEAPALVDLDMFNELDGWGVSEAEVVRTNDGGVTWYNVTPPDVTETGYGVNVFFLDPNHAWMLKQDNENYPNSGFLHRTADGGITWTTVTVPFSSAHLQFIDRDLGWALADLGVGAGSNAVAVYQTEDGGATWESTYTNDPNLPNAADSLPLGGLKSGIVARDMETAWVSGVTYAPGEIYLYRSDDGGRTWMRVTVPMPQGAEAFELGIDADQMKFTSAADGFFAVRMAGEAMQTILYATNDGGETWMLTPAVIPGAGSMEFLSAQEVVLYDGEQFYVTRDAAQSWVTVRPDVAFGESFAGMEFVNTMTGWVITADPTTNHRSLYRTNDGGAIWFPVIP